MSPAFIAKKFPEEKIMKTQNPKASIAIQVLPSAKNQDELIRIVDEVIAFIKSSGLNCHVGPFETTVEGDIDEAILLSDRIYPLSSTPGEIIGEISIEEKRPRSDDFNLTPEFLKYKREILSLMKKASLN